ACPACVSSRAPPMRSSTRATVSLGFVTLRFSGRDRVATGAILSCSEWALAARTCAPVRAFRLPKLGLEPRYGVGQRVFIAAGGCLRNERTLARRVELKQHPAVRSVSLEANHRVHSTAHSPGGPANRSSRPLPQLLGYRSVMRLNDYLHSRYPPSSGGEGVRVFRRLRVPT